MKFSDLNLNKSLLNALGDLNLETPTAIQEQVFSTVMSGRDVCGIAETGTGKTLSYLLPLIRLWTFSKDKLPQILVLVPTRELVVQVVEMTNELSKYLSFNTVGVYGGVNMKTQITELNKGCDLVVATPGRFIDLAASGALKVKNIKKVVLDEFDLMLDLGFRPQLETIFDKIPEKRQSLLFSATLTEDVKALLNVFFLNPILIEANSTNSPLDNIEQKSFLLPNFNTKVNFLEILLEQDQEMVKNLVFVANKSHADILFEKLLNAERNDIEVIHSNKSQNYRFNAIQKFESGEVTTLIATDLVARGIDFDSVSHVVNFEMPEEAESFLHRIGRTARANKTGNAITFFTEKETAMKIQIEEYINKKIPTFPNPAFLEISDEILSFEMEDEPQMKIINVKKVEAGPAFHEKSEKNKKVNVRRNIEEEKKRKYGKAYKKSM